MWLEPYFENKVAQDIVATLATFALAVAWLRLVDALAHRGLLAQRLSRKIIHIGTGPLFVLCWNLFSAEPWARWAAALVPLAITGQFVAVGLGWLRDEAAVKAMTRAGDAREILPALGRPQAAVQPREELGRLGGHAGGQLRLRLWLPGAVQWVGELHPTAGFGGSGRRCSRDRAGGHSGGSPAFSRY